MSVRLTAGLSALVLLVTACAPRARTGAQGSPGPLKPKAGPPAALYVNYSGGLLDRQVTASFSVDRDAHVLVGHLGGDGVISVIYPESPSRRGMVPANTTVRTDAFAATFDAMRPMLSYAVSPFRLSGAMMDSYDGRGNGYVFIVTSDEPLDFDDFADGGEWDEIYVENFHGTSDPRWAIRDFADMLADGRGFSLKFASGTRTQYMHAFASHAWSCSLLMGLGFTPFSSWYFLGVGSTWDRYYNVSSFYGSSRYCGGNPWFAYDRMQRYRSPRWIGWISPVRPATVPTVATTPTIERPGRRPLGERTLTTSGHRGRTGELAPPPRATITSGPRRDIDERRRERGEWTERARPVEKRTVERRGTEETEERARPTRPRRTDRTARPTERRERPTGRTTSGTRERPTPRPAQSKPTRPKPDGQ